MTFRMTKGMLTKMKVKEKLVKVKEKWVRV